MKNITLLALFIFINITIINSQNVIVDQVNDAANVGLIVSFQGNDNVGVFSADDFTLTSSTVLGEMDFEGNIGAPNFTTLLGFNILI